MSRKDHQEELDTKPYFSDPSWSEFGEASFRDHKKETVHCFLSGMSRADFDILFLCDLLDKVTMQKRTQLQAKTLGK